MLWRTPLGYVYLVNDSGTHDLGHGPLAHAIWEAAGEHTDLDRSAHDPIFLEYLFGAAG